MAYIKLSQARGGNWAPQELVEDNEMAPSGSEISRKQL